MEEFEVHILVVEDDNFQRYVLEDIMDICEFKCSAAENGRVAWDLLNQPGADFNIVLLDLMMPEMDGLELLGLIKDSPKLKDLPVVMMSSNDERSSIVACLDRGAIDFLVKPVKPGTVKGLVNHVRTMPKQAPEVEGLQGLSAYTRIQNLGKGAFGSVDLVRKKSTNELFALKRIDFSFNSEQARMNAKMEAKLLKVLSVPTITRYYEDFEEENSLVIVMEYAAGGSLSEKLTDIKNSGMTVPTDKVVAWLSQIVIALMQIHSKHILHRDLKTQNIFLTEDDLIKVGDFGIAKALNDTADFAKTSVGTPYFMAPEVIRGEKYQEKADIWALGCILYEIVTFKKPFDERDISRVFEQITSKEFMPMPSHVDLNIKVLVSMMLSKDPAQRPTIWEIANAPIVKQYIEQFIEQTNCTEIMPLLEQNSNRKSRRTEEAKRDERVQPAAILRVARQEVPLQDVKVGWLGTTYRRVFYGADLIRVLVGQLNFPSGQALTMSQDMLVQQLIHSVEGSPGFAETKLYIFQEDRTDVARNQVFSWTKEVRETNTVMTGLVSQANLMQTRYSADLREALNSAEMSTFMRCIGELTRVEVKSLARHQRLAFFINLYQIMQLHQAIEMPDQKAGWFSNPTDAFYYNVSQLNFTLKEVKHGVLRGNRKPPDAYMRVLSSSDPRNLLPDLSDPRILIACQDPPSPLRPILDFYNGLEEQLTSLTEEFCNRHVCINLATGDLTLPKLFLVYQKDFGSSEVEVLRWIWRHFTACRVSFDVVCSQLKSQQLFVQYDQ
jgi:NIMA (never in mitosis gene a)-related kinase